MCGLRFMEQHPDLQPLRRIGLGLQQRLIALDIELQDRRVFVHDFAPLSMRYRPDTLTLAQT